MKKLKAFSIVWLTLVAIFIVVGLGHIAMENPAYLLIVLAGGVLSLVTSISINILTGTS